jgi:rSAM/selenodomain-associated transferase 1
LIVEPREQLLHSLKPPLGLGLMCKPPRAGASKTRLAASIGAAKAAALSRAFLEDCAATCLAAAELALLAPTAFYRPDDAGDEIRALLGSRWRPVFCDAGELGATMLAALAALLEETPEGAIIMGADIPLITPQAIMAAAQALRTGHERSIVITPSIDGGYCLIGIRSVAAAAPLFAPMPWSTSQVFEETMARAARAKLDVGVMPPERDIDDQADLAWLEAEFRRQALGAKATRAALATLSGQAESP